MAALRTAILCAGVLAASGPLAGEEPAMVERRFAFQGGQFDNTRLRPIVQGTVKLLQPGPNGLRVSIPAGEKPDKVAIKALCVPQGDFEITASFELTRIETPKTGFGVGPAIYVHFKSPGGDSSILSRRARVKEGEVFATYYATTVSTESQATEKKEKSETNAKNEKDQKSEKKRKQHVKLAAAKKQAGKLRIVRSGSTLSYFVVDGPGDDFRQIDRFPTVGSDVEELEITLERGGAPVAAGVIWKDLVIRAQSFRGESGKPEGRTGTVLFLIAILLAVMGTGGALYWWQRRKRKASPLPAATLPADNQAGDRSAGTPPTGTPPTGTPPVGKPPAAKQHAGKQPAVRRPA